MVDTFNSSPLFASADLGELLRADFPAVLKRWRACVEGDDAIQKVSHLTRAQFYNHVPHILEAFAARLETVEPADSQPEHRFELEMAFAHSQHRWQQGFDLTSLVREWGHLNGCVLASIDEIAARADGSAGTDVFARARAVWAEVVNQNLSEGVGHYTELLQMEAQARFNDLESALEQVSAWERERGQVLRQASHDLRGSLSVVAGASSLLETSALEDEDRTRVTKMLQGGVQALSEMLGDLLDMSRLEAGHEKCEIAPFDAALILRVLVEGAQSLAAAKNLSLEIDGPPTLFVDGDSTKVQRIAQNLLLNALKYTHSGGVKLRYEQSEPLTWRLEVSDSGPGIGRSGAAPMAEMLASATETAREVGAESSQTIQANDNADKISDALSTSSDQNAFDNTPGEGIGLSIVRRLCELLGATLELDSSTKGSSFRVVFPASY